MLLISFSWANEQMIVSAGHAIVGCKHRRWAGVKTCHGLFTPLNHDKLFITHKLTCAPKGTCSEPPFPFPGAKIEKGWVQLVIVYDLTRDVKYNLLDPNLQERGAVMGRRAHNPKFAGLNGCRKQCHCVGNSCRRLNMRREGVSPTWLKYFRRQFYNSIVHCSFLRSIGPLPTRVWTSVYHFWDRL